MRVKYFAWFESKHEKTEFLDLIRTCRSDMEAVIKIVNKYPKVTLSEAQGVVDNFKKELNTIKK